MKKRMLATCAALTVLCVSAAGGGTVEAQKSVGKEWQAYPVRTVENAAGEDGAALDEFGGWKNRHVGNKTGFFQVKEIDGRWCFVDPAGNRFLSKGVVSLRPGRSERQQAALKEKFGDLHGFLQHEAEFLKTNGFNTTGAWSDTKKDRSVRIAYTGMLDVMKPLNRRLRDSGADAEGFANADKEGYPWGVAQVFSPEFPAMAEKGIKEAAKYADDKWLVGYFIDNEIPFDRGDLWKCLTKWPKEHPNRKAAQKWLDHRCHKAGATLKDASEQDRLDFAAYELETYLKVVTSLLKKYDPNHLFLGSRYNKWKNQLENESFMKTAGKYVDVVSINHYNKWEPDGELVANWLKWSGRPFLITEFYVKGMDSGLKNDTGAGWNVRTQSDRGRFYQNFCLKLMESKGCIGWHWFRYQDNDPEDKTTDHSNKDSNKGIVRWDFSRYDEVVELMRALNRAVR